MSTVPVRRMTPAEYLARERTADFKSGFYRGEMFAMAGASRNHNLIMMNVGAALHQRLADKPCEVYGSDLRVLVDRTGLYTYPDVVVTCGEPQFEDEHVDTLLNPRVLVEVLSKSTEAYDRGTKSSHYRMIPSLQEYLLIAQHEPRVEVYQRHEAGTWLLSEARSLEESVHLPSLDLTLALADVYSKIEFQPETELEEPRTGQR